MDGNGRRAFSHEAMTHPIESGEVKAEQQQPVLPLKKRRKPKPEKSAQAANGGSSSSATGSFSLSRTSSSSPLSGDADGKCQQLQLQQQHDQQGGKRPRLVWTSELHDLFVQAYDSLGDDAVPRRILEKMNERMNVPEISREKVASHLQKHKLHLRRLAQEASPTKEAPAASHSRRLPPITTPLADVSQASQVELVQQLPQEPPDCLSRSGSSIAANLQIVQSIQQQQQQQLCGPSIKEGPAETTQQAPADSAGCSLVAMETSIAAILVPAEAINTEEAVIRMVQAANTENAAEPEEAAPAPSGIIEQFWTSPDNEAAASISSWDLFVLPRGT